MNPIAFHIFSFPIRWYGIMAALGVTAAYFMVKKNRDYAKLTVEQIADIVFLLITTGVIGARVFYVIEYFDQFRYTYINGVKVVRPTFEMMLETLKIYNGGIVFYGGFICATIAMIIYCRVKKLNFWAITDVCVPGLAIGHAFGRLGCFLNGCCFGKATNVPWGVTYNAGTVPAQQCPDLTQTPVMIKVGETLQAACPSVHIHPVQLYEVGANIILAIILNFTLRKLKLGQNLALYMILYGVIRFSDEFFRGDHKSADLFLSIFTPAQFIGLFLIPLGAGLFIYFQKRPDNLSLED